MRSILSMSCLLMLACGNSSGRNPALASVSPMPPSTEGVRRVSADGRVTIGDQVNYTKGSYLAYAASWCTQFAKALRIGIDVSASITIVPDTFPDGVGIVATAPDTDPGYYKCGVYGYNFVSYGNYDGGTVEDRVRSARAKDIKELSVLFDVDAGGSEGQYNVLNEFFLTNRAGADADKAIEIGYLLHASAPARRFAQTGDAIGRYTDPVGRSWDVTKVGIYVMLLPADGTDVQSGSLDIRHLLRFLIGKKTISGDEWFNGIAMGLEPVTGKSRLAIRRWWVDYR